MKIFVIGTRGIPGIQGGVETHCEELFPRIVDSEHEVIVVRRKKYISKGFETKEFKGVKIKDLGNLSSKHFEAFFHTFNAILYARRVNADIVHIHAVGPSIMTPVARILGMKVVTTHHGPDYDRQKWGKFAKSILRLGEKWGALYSNAVIVISKHIKDIINTKYPSQKNVHLIYNGVNLPSPSKEDILGKYGLEKGKYILAVGRFVEEKAFHILIDAYRKAGISDIKLVIAGDADHEDSYSKNLKSMAKEAGAILTGFIQKNIIVQLYRNCRLFVLPSFHEGLPISLLEAMSCNCNVLVSDIPANVEVGLDSKHYFRCGDVNSLRCMMLERLADETEYCYDMSVYDWDVIASQTKAVYDSLV